MKNVTTKLLLSFGVISMAIIALSTVTLAWFTLSNTVKVNEFELNIIQDDGLEVRIVQSNPDYDSGWVINASTKVRGDLIPITTVDGIIFKNFDFTEASTGHYISFRAYFRSRVNCNLYLSKMDSSSSKCIFAPDVDVKVLYDNNVITYGPKRQNKVISNILVSDAFRASFIINGKSNIFIFNKDKGQGCYNGFRYNDLWYNPAINYYNSIYGISLTNPFVYIDSENQVVDELDYINDFKTNLYLYHNSVSLSSNNEPASKMKVLDINSNLFPLIFNNETNYYEGFMDVNIWLEGWDADCFDAINNTTLSMIMGFKKKDN